jgi:hypothetical protein
MVAAPLSAGGLLGNAIGKAMNNHGSGPVWFDRQDSLKGLNQAVLGQFSVVFLTKRVTTRPRPSASLPGQARRIIRRSPMRSMPISAPS